MAKLATVLMQHTALVDRQRCAFGHRDQGRGVAHAADEVLGARQNLARIEGLGDVFVGAAFEADDAFDLEVEAIEARCYTVMASAPYTAQRETVGLTLLKR